MQPVTLRTARLELSIPTPADADAIAAGAQDPEVPRWTTVPSPYSRADADEFVEKAAGWWDAGTDLVWSVRADGRWLGLVGMHRIVPQGEGEIGYWMAASSRGHGYVTEASQAVIDFVFAAPLSLERVAWRAVVGNVPSARTARALGFRYEGTLRRGLGSARGREDGWIAALLRTDDRTPQPWPVLAD